MCLEEGKLCSLQMFYKIQSKKSAMVLSKTYCNKLSLEVI